MARDELWTRHSLNTEFRHSNNVREMHAEICSDYYQRSNKIEIKIKGNDND